MRSKNAFILVTKEKLIIDFEKSCEEVGAAGLLDVKQDCLLVRVVDRVLQHGLRDPVRGYWSLVRGLTHSTTLKSIEAFVKYISSSQQKGLAWTFYTLDEGSLEYYLSSLAQDSKTLNQHYLEQSLLRDPALAQRVVTSLTNLRSEAAAIQASMESSVISEQASSLASPVDSGVALVDSDNSTENEFQEYMRGQHGSELGSSVNTHVSSSSDNTLAEDTTNGNCKPAEPTTDNIQITGIMAQNKHDGVCRRPRKKKKSESAKRVSFHQDSNDDSETGVRQPSNINNFFVEGRYSWAGEGDSFFMKEKENFRQVKSEIYERKGLSSSINIFESELGIEADCDGDSSTTTLDDTKYNIEMVCEKLANVVKQSLGLKTKDSEELRDKETEKTPLTERGVPEGQEDPKTFSEYDRLLGARGASTLRSSIDQTSDSEWSLDTPDGLLKMRFIRYPGSQKSTPRQPNWPGRMLHEAPSKTSLVKRFLNSIPTRKPYKDKKPVGKPNLYIKGVKPDPELSKELLESLEEEMKSIQPQDEGEDERITEPMRTALQSTVLMDKAETILKVYRVASTEGVPLLAVLTVSALYMAGLGPDNSYCRRHHINYHTLDTVVIGPEYQTLMLVTMDHRVTVTVISALGQSLVCHMMSRLSLSVYRATKTHLNVRQLSLASTLYNALLSQASLTKDETLHFYRYIRVEDSYMTGPQSLTRSGHLMYRSHSTAPWLPGFILLSSGLIYIFSDASQKSPKHILSLHRGYFGGCRRVYNSNRPHTFEVLPFGQRGLTGTFQFAAADDYECSDWLQTFFEISSNMVDNKHVVTCKQPVEGCGLLLTSRRLLTLDFPHKVLGCASLQDISAIRTASTACILETNCCEVQGSGGDWILYFLTDQAITEFLDALYQLRPELKQQASVGTWESEVLHRHCLQTSHSVRTAWDPLLRPSVLKQNSR
ncbi:pleckstrin homology domain-containing family M member 2-like isoform X1 [Macrosteles quadrilineatus]|uniref:pleckstrin homology domain-containing family M member 2-like isoform X1 n=1 Tax=Macrosteles quadrilineatus TaxID=74068 RepID=UPI0023E0C072|nr:pleckstrin homology domain-containing family M member 2-like isoform X1 [Macrosteles quadrilineatus]